MSDPYIGQTSPAMGLANVGEILGALVASGPQGAAQAAARIDARSEGARQRAWESFTRMQDMQFQAAQKQMDRQHDAAMRRMEHSLTKGDEIKQAAGQLQALMLASPAQFQTFKNTNPGLAPQDAGAEVWALSAARTMGGRGAIATFDGMAARTQAEAQLGSMGVAVGLDQDPTMVLAEIQRRQGPAENILQGLETRLTEIGSRLQDARQLGAERESFEIQGLTSELAGWQDQFQSLEGNFGEFFMPGGMGDQSGLPGRYAGLAAHAATMQGALGIADNGNRRRAAVGTAPSGLNQGSPLFSTALTESPELRAEAVNDYVAAHGESWDGILRGIATVAPETLIEVYGEDAYNRTLKPLIENGRDMRQIIESAMALSGSPSGAGEMAGELALVSQLAKLGNRAPQIQQVTATNLAVDAEVTRVEGQLDLLGFTLADFDGLNLTEAAKSAIQYNATNGTASVREGGVYMDQGVVDNIFNALKERDWTPVVSEDPLGAASVLAKRIAAVGENTPLGSGLRQKASNLFKQTAMLQGEGAVELHPELAEFYIRSTGDTRTYGNSEHLAQRGEDIMTGLTSPMIPSFLTMDGQDADGLVVWKTVRDELSRGGNAPLIRRPLRNKDNDIKSALVRQNPIAALYQRSYRGELRTIPDFDDLPDNLAERMRKDMGVSSADFKMEYGRFVDALRLSDFLNARLEPTNPMFGLQRAMSQADPADLYNTVVTGAGMPLDDLFPQGGGIPMNQLGFGSMVDNSQESVAYGSTTRGLDEIRSTTTLAENILADLQRRQSLVAGEGRAGFEPVIDIDVQVGPGEEIRKIDAQSLASESARIAQRIETLKGEEIVLADNGGAYGALDRAAAFSILEYAAANRKLNLAGREELAQTVMSHVEPLFGATLVPGLEKGPALLSALKSDLQNATDGEALVRGLFRGEAAMLGQLITASKDIPQGELRGAAVIASRKAFDRSVRDIEALALHPQILDLKLADIGDPTVRAELEQVKWDSMITGTGSEEPTSRWWKASVLWAAMSKAAYARQQ